MTRSRTILAAVTVTAAVLFAAGPASAQNPTVTVEPATDLADGDTLTVTVSGFPASGTSFVSGQCVTPIEDPLVQCDVGNIVPVPLDADGAGTFEITVKTGPIGSGECGADGDQCVILVGSLTEPENAAAPISFAPPVAEELAATGPSSILITLSLASALLFAGSALLWQARRFRRLA